MGIALGPDLWGNAPAAASPIVDLRQWLDTMDAAAAAWKPAANATVWQERFAGVRTAINDAESILPAADVFPTKAGAAAYDFACKVYQDTKDQFVLSSDWLLTAGEQAGIGQGVPDLFDKIAALLRATGIGLLGAAVLVLVVAIVIRRSLA
jgi:hypothetical protein